MTKEDAVARMERSVIRVRSLGLYAVPGFRFASPGLRNLFGSLPANKEGSGPPADALRSNADRRENLYACGAQGAPRRRRLAPPFRFGRARLPAFHSGTCGRDRTPPLSSSSRASWGGTTQERALPVPCRPSAAGAFHPRRPVIVPAGRFGPEPPGSEADNPARGNRPRPCQPASPGRRPSGRSVTACIYGGDQCQATVSQ